MEIDILDFILRVYITDYQYYVKDTTVLPTVDRNGYSRLN